MITPKAIAEETADVLTMMASQIREAANGQGSYPSPWRLDDCVSAYRQAYRELMTPNAEFRGAKPIGEASRSNDVLGGG